MPEFRTSDYVATPAARRFFLVLLLPLFLSLPSREQVPDNLRESLGVAEAPEFEMLSKGGVFMQSDEVGKSTTAV